MFEHKDLFETLLGHKNGLKLNSVNVVERVVMSLDEKGKLRSVGLGEYEPVFFDVIGDTYCKGILDQCNSNLDGSVINIQTDKGYEQVVFIPETVPAEPAIPSEYHDDWSYMLKLAALAHELGHVVDMQRTTDSNFDFSGVPKVNLVEAEAFAHVYSLELLHRMGAHTARDTVASALRRASTSSKKFEKELYQSVCRKVGKGRLKRWAA
ncbi:hypothetical protein ACQKP8_27255 [Photobacterium alginatilyticum]|uniref:hypothetical protein n=1 Tax=Photobacterium alginatilyticum TaxID=1775171 RepID=UPI004068C9BB